MSSQPPLVSIVIPTYNRSHLLPRSVESCLRQSHSNLEVIIVDDGSPDSTPEVARALADADSRVHYVRQPNGKLPAALNTGHARARGEYMTWTSDDNRYDPDAIEVMVRYMQAHPGTGLVYCNCRLVNADGDTVAVRDLPGPDRLWEGSCVGACFLYRRSVYEVVGEYDRDLFLAEDYDYWLRISRAFPIAHLSQVAYSAMVHPGSLTETRKAQVQLQCARAQAKNAPTPSLARQYMASGLFDAAWVYRRQGDWKAALATQFKAWRYSPYQPRNYRALLGIFADGFHALCGRPIRNQSGR